MLNEVLKRFLQKSNLLLLIALGSLSWFLTMVKSGRVYSSLGDSGPGLGFWGANGHDGIWHIALSESLSRGVVQMPVFASARLQNYHIGFDVILAVIHRITYIPTVNLYFQIIPLVLAVLIGYLSYKFVFIWTNSRLSALWASFFVYFGGSFGWLIGHGESTFWSQQSVSTLINPPFALSLILLLTGLILLVKLDQKYETLKFVFCIIIFGCLIEVKAYAGILGLGALFVSAVYSAFLYKKYLQLKVFIWSLILAVFLYLPFNSTASGLLVFQPFWFLETMMGLTDRVNWPRFYSAMLNYRSGGDYIKGTLAYLAAFAIFWVGNMGTRIIGLALLVKWVKNIKKISWIEIFMSSIIVGGVVLPMLFVQKGTPWNTIQFFYYTIFFSSVLAGVVLSYIKQKIVVVILVLLTIPITALTLKDVYIPPRPPAILGIDEISALRFLSGQPEGVVLTRPFSDFDSKNAENNPPRPLYLYTSTAYVSAFSKHQTFLEDEINLDITGYKWQERRMDVIDWYTYQEENPEKARQFLLDASIKYIYWIKKGQSPLDLAKLGLLNIYENDLITIYKVD